MNIVSDDSPELPSTSVDEFIFHFCGDILAIVAEVGNLGSASEIRFIPDNRISNVGEMWNMRIFTDIGVLEFYK